MEINMNIVLKWALKPLKGILERLLIQELKDKESYVINLIVTKVQLPVAGEVEEAIVKKIYDTFEECITLFIKGL
jgi:hypothetical protein